MPTQQLPLEVRKRIQDVKENQKVFLDLGHCQLSDKHIQSLENELYELIHLETLCLGTGYYDVEGRFIHSHSASRNRITQLPKLPSHLKHLYLSQLGLTQITQVETLLQLESLDLTGNDNIQAYEALTKCTQLRNLFLGRNKLNNLPEGIENLTELVRLELSNNNLIDITDISSLSKLEMLWLQENKLEHLQGLENLKGLRFLNASYNKLKEISALEHLYELKEVYLHNNKITEVGYLVRLDNIFTLDVSDNRISNISKLLPLIKKENPNLEVKSLKTRDSRNKQGIFVENNPLTTPPIDLLRQDKKSLLDYFAQLEGKNTQPAFLYEAKLLILGQAKVGKTSFKIKLLDRNKDLPKEEEETPYIDSRDIWKFQVDEKDKETVCHVHLWDFPGQTIKQTIHHLFLTRNAVCVWIWAGRSENAEGNEMYWVDVIRLFSKGSPTLILQNQRGENKSFFENNLLKDDNKRPSFVYYKKGGMDFCSIDLKVLGSQNPIRKVFYSLKERILPKISVYKGDFCISKQSSEGEKFNLFEQLIMHKVLGLVHIKSELPESWVEIRKELAVEKRPYISYKEFERICISKNVNTSQRIESIASLFHDIGVFFHYTETDNDYLKDYIFLQQDWLTKGVGALVNDKNQLECLQAGYFHKGVLNQIWKEKDYSNEEREMLSHLVVAFQICYEEAGRYVVPCLLRREMPKYVVPSNYHCLQKYKFEFATDTLIVNSVLMRLFVSLHHKIAKNQKAETLINDREAIFELKEAMAIVNKENRTIGIEIHAMDIRSADTMLERLKDEMDKLVEDFPTQLKPKLSHRCPCKNVSDPCMWKMEDVRKSYATKPDGQYWCKQDSSKPIDLHDLLGVSKGIPRNIKEFEEKIAALLAQPNGLEAAQKIIAQIDSAYNKEDNFLDTEVQKGFNLDVLEDFVISDDTKKALEYLKQYAKETKGVILLLAQCNRLVKENTGGTISAEQRNLIQNQLNKNILEIAESFKNTKST